jgi:hypothetical protein
MDSGSSEHLHSPIRGEGANRQVFRFIGSGHLTLLRAGLRKNAEESKASVTRLPELAPANRSFRRGRDQSRLAAPEIRVVDTDH